MSVLAKFDAGLQAIYTSYRDVQERGADNVGRVHSAVARATATYVYLRYAPPLAPIEALGFETVNDDGKGYAMGRVRFADLERIGAHDGVLHMATGTAPRPLDLSIPDIKADKVWSIDRSTKLFGGTTGKNVIVGIIDTGIDFGHPVFRDPITNDTRILRIWDMGLSPRPSEKSPLPSLLTGGGTYGVEYSDDDLNEHLALKYGAPVNGKVRHRDCAGHGTHVASIAAGNGSEGGFKYIGVAPEADIIAVKMIELEEDPVDSTGAAVESLKLLKDAVTYLINTAQDFGRPLVINMSLGYDLGPHDGLTEEERFLADTFPDTVAGRACVVAAGNEGAIANHCEITVVGPGTAVVPFLLLDGRGEHKGDYGRCTFRDDTIPLGVEIWYPRGPVVKASAKIPGVGMTDPVAVGQSKEGFYKGKKKYELTHKAAPDVAVGTLTAKRNVIALTLRADGKNHELDWYEVHVECDRAADFEAWANSDGSLLGQHARFPDRPAETTPPELQVQDWHKMAAYAGSAGVISVAMTSSEPGPPPGPPFDEFTPETHSHVRFSSAGGVVDYTGTLAESPPTKPDITAPGWAIDAAKSAGRCWFAYARLGLVPYGYIDMLGTSMASPHVAGAIALMLQTKTNLTLGEIRHALATSADPRPSDPNPDKDLLLARQFGAGYLNVEKAVAAVKGH
jgi:subtilisin family serine protease